MKRKSRKQRGPFPFRVVAIATALVLILFATGYLVAVRLIFPPLPAPKNGIMVPALTGLQVPAAEAKLARIGLRVSDVVEIAHPTQPAGIIVAQNPLPGQQLRTAGAVTVGVSSGLPRVTVPNVIGFTLERALAVLSAAGLEADQQTEAGVQPAGTVIRMSPAAGTDTPTPGRVLLIVSSGPTIQPLDSTPVAPDTLAVSASTGTTYF